MKLYDFRMMKNFVKSDKVSKFAKIVNKEGKNIYKVGQEGAIAFSTFSQEETAAFTRVINTVLSNDKHVQKNLAY
jgi:hypothetical protein